MPIKIDPNARGVLIKLFGDDATADAFMAAEHVVDENNVFEWGEYVAKVNETNCVMTVQKKGEPMGALVRFSYT